MVLGNQNMYHRMLFFKENRQIVTVNSEHYPKMLATFLIPELKRKRLAVKNIRFQQDEATTHTGNNFIDYLSTKFCGHVVSHNGDIAWSARCSDLGVCDFFLRRYFTAKVWIKRPYTLGELNNTINQRSAVMFKFRC